MRLPAGVDFQPPLRVVLDARLDALAPGCHLLDGSVPTLVVHGEGAAVPAAYAAVECLPLPLEQGRIPLPRLLRELAARGVNEIQAEAGPALAGSLYAAGLVDELLLYVAPLLLGDAGLPLLRLPLLSDMAARWPLRLLEQRQLGEDWRLLLRPLPAGQAAP